MPKKHPQQHGWRWKRTAVMVMLLLTGGAIVNVAVAWGCAVYGRLDRSGTIYIPDQAEHSVWRDRTPSVVVGEPSLVVRSRSWGFAAMHMVADRPPDSTLETTGGEEGSVVGISFKSHVRRPDVLDAVLVVNAGWPMRALQGRRWHLHVPIGWHFSESGLVIQEGRRGTSISDSELPVDINTARAGEFRVLPLRPLWSGFAINTLFYALLLWLLLFGPFAARRMIRRRRGQCEKCAYPVGVSPVCTECGAAVRRKSKLDATHHREA